MANEEYAAADELLPSYSRLNQPTFEELQKARTGNGFQHLGNAIGGALGGGAYRDLRGQQVFNQAATGSARLQDILLQANQRRDTEIGRRALAQQYANKGDTEAAQMALTAKDPAEFQQALLHRDRLTALGEQAANFRGLGYADPLATAMGGLVRASGGSNTEGDVKAGLTAAIPYAGSAPVGGLTTTQLGGAIVPNNTRMGPHGEMYSEVGPATQATVGTPATAAYLKSEAALQAERYASAERQKQGMGRDKLALSTNPDTNEVTVVDLTQGTSRPVTTALGDMAGPPATLKAPAKGGAGKSSFSPTELIDVTGSAKDSNGKYLPDQNNIQRFYDTKAAMKQAGDPNWNNDPLVLAKMKATDAENASEAAATGPPTDLATPPKPFYVLSSGTVPQQVDAQGRAITGLGDSMDATQTPDITYDPQNRGLPNTTNDVAQAQQLAATRDAAIAAQANPKGVVPTQTATNPKTGQKMGLVNGQWIPL